jgi:hypothetical protein
MISLPLRLLGSAMLGWGLLGVADAEPLLSAPSPGAQCRAAIAATERTTAIPPQLMAAIGMIESGRRDPANGLVAPWPWSVEAEGQGTTYDTKAQAIAAVRALQARGVQSIDVGCMQVNLFHHPTAFATLEQAFDPMANAIYAARFLTELFAQTHDWPLAAGMYHSGTPELRIPYQAKVMAAWPEERRLAAQASPGMSRLAARTLPEVRSPAAQTLPDERRLAAQAFLSALAPPAGPARIPRPGDGLYQGGMPATIPHLGMTAGRDLAAYRAAPVLLAARTPLVMPRY